MRPTTPARISSSESTRHPVAGSPSEITDGSGRVKPADRLSATAQTDSNRPEMMRTNHAMMTEPPSTRSSWLAGYDTSSSGVSA